MARTGTKVRKKAETKVGTDEAAKGLPKQAEEPARLPKVKRADCKTFLQDKVAEVLPDVMDRAKDKVLKGDLTTFKKLWDMSGLDKQTTKERKRSGGLGSRLLRRMKRKDEEKPKQVLVRSAQGRFAKRVEAAE